MQKGLARGTTLTLGAGTQPCPHLSGAKSDDLDLITVWTFLDFPYKLSQLSVRPTAVKYLPMHTRKHAHRRFQRLAMLLRSQRCNIPF